MTEDTLLQWLGEAAKRTRMEAGWSPETVAPLIGMNNTTLRRFEAGQTLPRNLEDVMAAYSWLGGMDRPTDLLEMALRLWQSEGEEPEKPEHLEEVAGIFGMTPERKRAPRNGGRARANRRKG